MCAVYAVNGKKEFMAAAISGIIFSAIYDTIIFLVYYAEFTTVRMNSTLSDEALSIISFGHTGSLFLTMIFWGMHSWHFQPS